MRPPPLGEGQALAVLRSIDGCPDPIELYAACSDGGRRHHTLLLESAEHQAESGNQSVLLSRAALRITSRGHVVTIDALTPNGVSVLPRLGRELSSRAEVEVDPNRIVARFGAIPRANERERLLSPSVLDAVRATILGLHVEGSGVPPMVAGVIGYDLLGAFESLPDAASDALDFPDMDLWLAEELVFIHHVARKTSVHRFVFGGAHCEAAYHDATEGVAEMVKRCETVARMTATERAAHAEMRGQLHAPDINSECDMDDQAFMSLVDHLKKHIVRGDVFQIVPSRTFRMPCPDPLAAYRELRALNPSPYMFYVSGPSGTLFGASPESALCVRGSAPRRVSINPIAGTRARARGADGSIDADRDGRVEAELRRDDKEVAEHMMLVDLARNDVARVSVSGTRATDRLLDVVRYSHVMHLVSVVSGELLPELDALHAYTATMNMGTLVGAPKLEAAKLLRRYEPCKRGPYGGAVGYLTSYGRLDSCIVIRSALVKDGVAHVRAGCGVVYDSDPRSEADETRKKAQAVLVAIARAARTNGAPG